MAITWSYVYYIPFMWWCLLSSFFNPATCLQNETDKLALLSFKNAIQQDPFQALSSWNHSLHYCNWKGVSCSRRHPDRVIALKLNSQGLVGSLSSHIGNLSFLRRIDFHSNSFHGQIPQEIDRLHRLKFLTLGNNSFSGNIPANLSYCSNLVFLNLTDNKVHGNIPSELGSLSKLKALELSRNNLTGRIPPSTGNLSSLQVITLERNGLQGKIPEEISQLGNLEYLLFYENNLSGEIPSGLYNISSIYTFEIDFNRFHGSIPSDIGLTLPNLKYLILASNRFTGSIPISLSNASLKAIVFAENYFTGMIPKDLGKLPYLDLIELSYNQLEDDLSFISSLINCSNLNNIGVASNFLKGSIPISIANLSKQLHYISLSSNQLQGTIPMGVNNLVNLRSVYLFENHLTGTIDHINFEKFHKLEVLILENNKFTGTIPSSIGNLSMLSKFSLAFNNLHGKISPSLGNCHNLIYLDLSHNSLSGSIPIQVISLSSLTISLNLSGNALTGPIPSQVGFLQNLVQLDLSHNKLSGMIPNSIVKCSSLEQLQLEGNSFQGEIPHAFSALQGLRELDLSRNNFSGQIPIYLSELKGLNYLSLSFNQLQGEVPKPGIFLKASEVSLLGNNGLCGGIAELNLSSCIFQKSKNKLSFALKVIVPVAVVATFFSLLACFLIFRHRKRMLRKKDVSKSSFEHQFLRISYGELFKAMNGFSIENVIGVGSYGSVYKGFLEQEGIEVAVKVLNLQQRGASTSFVSECQALRRIRHRNLLKLLSVCSSIDYEGNDFKALIYEFMYNGSLEKWLHAHDAREDGQIGESRNLKLIDRLNISIDIATAIEYLHNGTSTTIIHGDLKQSNVLLDEDMNAHIGDFGLAKIVSTISGEAVQYRSSSIAVKGSIGYVAPEYGMGDLVSTEGDVYSYGILLLEIFTGKKPTDDSFRDDLNLHAFVLRSLPHGVMDIIDQRILSENGRESFKEIIHSVLRIGVACSMQQPIERMMIGDVTRELLKIKDVYVKGKAKARGRNAYQIGGPSNSHL